jgi:hypothetical protein
MDKLLPHQNLSLEDMEGEIWKDIQGYEGYYQISSFGRVKSLSRLVCRGYVFRMCKDKIRKIRFMNNGYLEVNLWLESKGKKFRVHRLVALNFINNPNKKSDVNHIDSIRFNNNVKNLEWVSHLENICHSKINRKTKSKYVGVSFSTKNKNAWQSYICINNKTIYLGIYKTEEEAYQARCEYEKNNNIENKYL